jgi:hypothetical protein
VRLGVAAGPAVGRLVDDDRWMAEDFRPRHGLPQKAALKTGGG